jgi:hypothetical protein
MASTRNRNTPGDYESEQREYQRQLDYFTYIHSQYGKPTESHFPGNGLLQGRVAPTVLSGNSCDVESFLYGIGSTNLVKPKSETTVEIYRLQSLNVADRLPLHMPDPLVVRNDERPYFM